MKNKNDMHENELLTLSSKSGNVKASMPARNDNLNPMPNTAAESTIGKSEDSKLEAETDSVAATTTKLPLKQTPSKPSMIIKATLTVNENARPMKYREPMPVKEQQNAIEHSENKKLGRKLDQESLHKPEIDTKNVAHQINHAPKLADQQNNHSHTLQDFSLSESFDDTDREIAHIMANNTGKRRKTPPITREIPSIQQQKRSMETISEIIYDNESQSPSQDVDDDDLRSPIQAAMIEQIEENSNQSKIDGASSVNSQISTMTNFGSETNLPNMVNSNSIKLESKITNFKVGLLQSNKYKLTESEDSQGSEVFDMRNNKGFNSKLTKNLYMTDGKGRRCSMSSAMKTKICVLM